MDIKRVSPVVFKSTPMKTEERDHWKVVLEYHGEGEGPWVTDLSHRPRLDLQTSDLDAKKPFGTKIPEDFCATTLNQGIAVNRMNGTQASIYDLASGKVALPAETEYTDVSENSVFVAIYGPRVFDICEKLSNLDFQDPQRKAPFLFQGPFSHVPCQIVTLCKDGEKSGIVLTCSRGYGEDMIHAILDAGEEFGLKPAGEARFTEWVTSL